MEQEVFDLLDPVYMGDTENFLARLYITTLFCDLVKHWNLDHTED